MQTLPDFCIVLAAHSTLQESADLAFPFRQDSNFWYMTGLNQPDMLLILDTQQHTCTLFIPDQNEYQQEWDGTINTESITSISAISKIEPKSKLHEYLKSAHDRNLSIGYCKPAPEIVEPYGFYSNPARRVLETELSKTTDELVDVRLHIAKLRQVKQPVELQAIQSAIDITAATLEDVKSRLSEFNNEKDLERAITAGFYSRGSDGHAYTPIIASGVNASIIHYNSNLNVLRQKELLLLDVGAKVDGYAADISRTWAVGEPSDMQKSVFDAVCRLQDRAFAMLKGGIDIHDYQLEMETYASKETKKLGIKAKKYPHGFSHFLGLDVHDAGDYSSPLLPGSVITVEPGLYFSELGVGVRLEDNILITEKGIQNLSKHIPRTL